MDKLIWPISPSFLSLSIDKNEEDAHFNDDGIYYPDYIRGFLADLSHDKRIQNALSIFQFVPESFRPFDLNADNQSEEISSNPKEVTVLWNKPIDERIKNILGSRKIIRIDSGTYVNNGRLCDAFRQCGYTDCCFQQDSFVGIFADEELNNYDHDSDFDKYRETLIKIINNINDNERKKDNISQIKWTSYPSKKSKRIYLHYTCPYSLFEEHIFPIYVQGHIIACLMLGQMARDTFDKEKSFYDYRSVMQIHTNIDDEIDNIKKIDKKDWDNKVKTIIDRIEIFEQRLKDRINHRNIRFINDAFDKIEQQFRSKVQQISVKGQHISTKFSNALNTAFDEIRETFDIDNEGFIRMFALPIDTKHDELIPIGWSGGQFNVKNRDSYNFTLGQLNQLKYLKVETSKKKEDSNDKDNLKNEIILKSGSSLIKTEFDNLDVFFYGKQVNDEIAYIVWKRHGSKIRKSGNQEIFKEYKKALKNFYSVALECYSYIRSARMELLLETTIRESVHESANFILPAIDVLEKQLNMAPEYMIYKNYINTFRNDILKPFEKRKEEVLESFYQLREINTGPSLIFSSELTIKKKPEQVFYLLYKLKKMQENRALDSHKRIFYDQNINYLEANIDKAYFNHALFNILDNAIKYGYDGSAIYIKMNSDKQKKELNVQFISYGIEIKKEDNIYELWERSEEAARMAKGTGIGMYIVKKICESHGGSIQYTSDWLSDYNIPVLFCYKYNNSLNRSIDTKERDNYDKELARIPKSIEKEVVIDHNFIKFAKVFTSRINTPTYRNIFLVTIPLK